MNLRETAVTDDGLAGLTDLPALAQLDLGQTAITGEGLKCLAGSKSLEVLDLNSAKLTDVGLRQLPALEKLRILTLYRTPITDEGLKGLAGLTRLRTSTSVYTGQRKWSRRAAQPQIARTARDHVSPSNGRALDGLAGLESLWMLRLDDNRKLTGTGLARSAA